MRLLGFNISRSKAAVPATTVPTGWDYSRGGWFPIVREPFTGAWQRNQEIRLDSVLTYSAIFACITLIASDVGKIRVRLVEQDDNGIWNEISAQSPFAPVLRKPNRYQTRIKFFEQWITSKLIHGNTYVLKERDQRGIVIALYVLDPCRTQPLVAPDGAVYYQLNRDNLAGITEEEASVAVPASEIIHDTMVCLYHPLCGVSPITACGLAAMQGLNIQNNSATFFQNGSNPGGILIAPGPINDEKAQKLKQKWDENYSGANSGKVAVLGDGLKYEALKWNAVDSQLIEQLKWSAETVCSCFHVPPYKIGVGPMPSLNNIEALNQEYYQQCLQTLFENIELLLDEGLGLIKVVGVTYGTEFDLDDLLRMDTKTMVEAERDAVGAGIKAPDEARKRLNLKPVPGGASPYLQQQNYSLEALAKRDAQADPFASKNPTAPPAPPTPKALEDLTDDDLAARTQIMTWELNSRFARAA